MEQKNASHNTSQQTSVKRILMSRLIESVKQCQKIFGTTKEIATEASTDVVYMLSQFEAVLYHGLRKNSSLFSSIKEMTERVTTIKLDGILTSGSLGDSLWACVRTLISEAELQRISQLKRVSTDTGRARSWLRASINERTLRRYLEQLTSDRQVLNFFYEEKAFLRDPEATAIFPQVCSGLDTILFAVNTDNHDLDCPPDVLDDETFENLLMEAKKAPQPIMAIRSSSRTRLDSSGSGGRRRRPLVNVVSFDSDRKLSETEGHMKVVTGNITRAKSGFLRSSSESEKLLSQDRKNGDGSSIVVQRPLAEANCWTSSLADSVFAGSESPQTNSSPMLYIQPGSGTVSEIKTALNHMRSQSVLSDDIRSEPTTRSRRSSLAEDDRHQFEEGTSSCGSANESRYSNLLTRTKKHQEVLDELKNGLRTLRMEHTDFVRHQLVRIDMTLKEQEMMKDFYQRRMTPQNQEQSKQHADNAVSEAANVNSDHSYEMKLLQLTQMHSELLELNEVLQRQLHEKNLLVKRLKNDLIALRGPMPEDFASDVNLSDSTTSSAVHIWIPAAFLTGKGSDVHHVYQVYVRLRNSEWNVYRRYADFHRLHKELLKKDSTIDQYNLPPKKKFGHKEKAFVEERRKKLESYLRVTVNHVIRKFPEFQALSLNKDTLAQLVPFFRD